MKYRPDHSPGRGMSLIEVLVTLALLTVVLLALAPLFSQSVSINASSNQLSVANSLAREKLEELLLYPTTDDKLTATDGTEVLSDLPSSWNPKTGEVSVPEKTGAGWFPYPYERVYEVDPFQYQHLAGADPVLVKVEPQSEATYNQPPYPAPYYDVKLITVTVRPPAGSRGPFPGLRTTRQSMYVRYRNVLAN